MRTIPTLVTIAATVAALAGPAVPPAAAQSSGDDSGHRGSFLVWSRFDDFKTGTARLVVADHHSRRVRTLTHPPAGVRDIDPRVSPDGRQVLFERDSGAASVAQAWLVGIDGRGERRLDLGCVDPCAGTNTPSWTPDGRHVLYDRVSGPFDASGGAASAALWKANLNGRHNKRFSDPGLEASTEETDPTFAPAGYLVVLHGRKDGHSAVFRLRADGTHPHQLTPWSLDADLPRVSPATSGPSRDLVVFETYGRGAPEGASVDQQVATVPATCRSVADCTSKITRLTRSARPAADFNPSWSPRGRHIAYVHFSYDEAHPPAVGDIETMRWDGAHKRPFSEDPRFEFRPAWGHVRGG